MTTGYTFESHGVQIRIRGTDPVVAGARAAKIARAMDKVHNRVVTVSGVQYQISSISRNPTLNMGVEREDDRRRHHLALNARTIITELDS